MSKAHGFKKARKRADIADQPLHLHFLAQVKPVVSLQDRLAVVGRPDNGQHALPQREVELEPIAQFSGHKSGHALNNKLLRSLLADTSTWEEVVFERYADAPISYIEAPALHPPRG